MSYECGVQDERNHPVLSVRSRTTVRDLPDFLGQAYRSVAEYLCELGEEPAGPPFAAYYNMDMQDLDVEAGFPVAERLPGRGTVQANETQGGKVVACVHVGPYGEIEPAYTALMQWIEDNGYEATGVAYEVYLNDPSDTPPAELRTQVLLPLRST